MTVQCAKCGNQLTTAQLSRGPNGLQCGYCGATVPVFDQNTLVTPEQPVLKPQAAPVAIQIDGYQVLALLGQGGMGDVYLGVQVSLNRKVAIKVLSAAFLQDPSFLARFDREIAALVRLTHPHIVTIFDRGQTADGQVYYVMEYVEGEADGAPLDLERMIAEGRLDSQRTRELMLQLVQALGFAHREGIIHRDVKPSNVLIDRHGFAKVADFGIACMRGDHAARQVTTANVAVGTAIYASPEQQRDAATVDHRADIYGAGVMLYQMLTGNLPLAGYAPPSVAVPGLNRQWDAIVGKAIQPRPEDRFGDMAEFESALRAIGPTVVAQPMPVPAPDAVRPRSSAGSSVPMVCPQCGGAACEADQFCVTCGVSLWHDCRQCGQRVFAAARFCPGCRADLENQRVFDDYVQLGKGHLDEAKQQPPSTDAVRHLEQARLAFGKALSCLDDADARALAEEVNQLTVNVAWQAGEAAAAATRLTEASYCYGQMLEASPGHAKAAACLKKIASYRSELVAKAQRLFAEGRRKNALALLRTGVEQFEDDAELAELWAQYNEDNAQLQELKDRIPALERENRWCEVAQVVAELSQSGAAMKGLDAESAKAQQRLAAVDPLVAAAKRSLDAGNTAQALAEANQALQHVADHAEAMEIVELARSRDRVAKRRASFKRRRFQFVLSIVVIACLAAGGVGVHVYTTEAQKVGQAEQQIRAGNYAEGLQTLNKLPQLYIRADRAAYLRNLAGLRSYASARNAPQPASLQTYRQGFLSLFAKSEGWRNQARADLKDTINSLIPADASDTLARSLAVARALKELRVAEPADLAAQLVAKGEERRKKGLVATNAEYAGQILEWDPGAADKLVNLTLPDGQSLEKELKTIQTWCQRGTPPARSLSAALVRWAKQKAAGDRLPEATLALDTATLIDPDPPRAFWETLFWEKKGQKDPGGAVAVLSIMVKGDRDPVKLQKSGQLYQSLKEEFGELTPPPPQELIPTIKRIEYDRLIAQGKQAANASQFAKALQTLKMAKERYPDFLDADDEAKSLHHKVAFAGALEDARQRIERNEPDFEGAEKSVNEALALRPEDTDALALRERIRKDWMASLAKEARRLLDAGDCDGASEHLRKALGKFPKDAQLLALLEEASVRQHVIAAERALNGGKLDDAAEEIVAARGLMPAGPLASWASVVRSSLDGLTNKVIDAACGQAEKLANPREYEEAEKSLMPARRLAPSDPRVTALDERIAKLKSASLSGMWRAPPGLWSVNNAFQFAPDSSTIKLTDRGEVITVEAVATPRFVVRLQGQFRRDKTQPSQLRGTFDFVLMDDSGNQINISADVSANVNVKDQNTLSVGWRKFDLVNLPKRQFELEGREPWTR